MQRRNLSKSDKIYSICIIARYSEAKDSLHIEEAIRSDGRKPRLAT